MAVRARVQELHGSGALETSLARMIGQRWRGSSQQFKADVPVPIMLRSCTTGQGESSCSYSTRRMQRLQNPDGSRTRSQPCRRQTDARGGQVSPRSRLFTNRTSAQTEFPVPFHEYCQFLRSLCSRNSSLQSCVPKFGWFRKLKNSARNSRFVLSDVRNFLKIEKSRSL